MYDGKIEQNTEVRRPLIGGVKPTKEYVASLRSRIKDIRPKIKHVTVSRINVNSTLTTSVQVSIGKYLKEDEYQALLKEIAKDMNCPREEFTRDACGSPVYNHIPMLVLTYNPTYEWGEYKNNESKKRKREQEDAVEWKKKHLAQCNSLYLPGNGTLNKKEWRNSSIDVSHSKWEVTFTWPDVAPSYNRYFGVYNDDELVSLTTDTSYSAPMVGETIAVQMWAGPPDKNIEDIHPLSLEVSF